MPFSYYRGIRDSIHNRWMADIMATATEKQAFDITLFLNTAGKGRSVLQYPKNRKVFSQAVVALHGNADFFGEGCLNGHHLRLATVVTMTECVITRIEKSAMVRVLHNKPKFSEMFMSYLLSRNSRVEEDLVDQLFNSSEKRLARVLLLMANFGKEGKPEPVLPRLSQETLAEMVGTTRPRVSFFMNKFRKLGFINYNGRLEVHNSLLNVVLHDNPHLRRGADRR